MFKITLIKKSKSSLCRVLSGICGNLSAGWFGLIIISPGVSRNFSLENILRLLTSLLFGLLFLWIAYKFDRKI
jgi:hypothetical protein